MHPSVPKGSGRLLSWLEESRDWTPLHHIEALSKERALALLRDGADTLPSTSLARVSTPQRNGSHAQAPSSTPAPPRRLSGRVRSATPSRCTSASRCTASRARHSTGSSAWGWGSTRRRAAASSASRSARARVLPSGDCATHATSLSDRWRHALQESQSEIARATGVDWSTADEKREARHVSIKPANLKGEQARLPPRGLVLVQRLHAPTLRPPLPPPLTHRSRPTGTCPADVATHE